MFTRVLLVLLTFIANGLYCQIIIIDDSLNINEIKETLEKTSRKIDIPIDSTKFNLNNCEFKVIKKLVRHYKKQIVKKTRIRRRSLRKFSVSKCGEYYIIGDIPRDQFDRSSYIIFINFKISSFTNFIILK